MLFFKSRLRRLRFWQALIIAYFARYRFRLFLTLFLTFTIVFTVYKISPIIFRSNILAVGYVGNYSLESIPSEVLTQVTGSLIKSSQSGKPLPSLSSHWTVSEDGKTYVVFLRDNITWHDLSQVSAKDISIAINNVKITALNNKTIEFVLPNPITSFPLVLDKPIFKVNTFYGTGNFVISAIEQNNGIVRKLSLHPKDKNLPRLEIKFYPSEEQAKIALKIGEVKTLYVSQAKDFETWPNMTVEKKIDTTEIVTIFFNNQDKLLASKELRQALSFAINKSNFDGEINHSPISSSSWAFNDSVKRYDYNVAKAKELLSKVNLQNSKITLTYTQDLEDLAQKIKTDWEAIGVITELKSEKNLPKDYQALVAINKLPRDPDQYGLWHSTQKETNITGYKNVKIDKLLEDGRISQEETKRKEFYLDFQKFLSEDAPATFLYHPYKYKVTYNNIAQLLAKLPETK